MSFALKILTTIITVVFVKFLLTDAIQGNIQKQFVKGIAVLNSHKTIQSFHNNNVLHNVFKTPQKTSAVLQATTKSHEHVS